MLPINKSVVRTRALAKQVFRGRIGLHESVSGGMLGCNNFDKEMSLLFRTRFAGCSPCDKNPERVIDISENDTTRDLEACIDGTRKKLTVLPCKHS